MKQKNKNKIRKGLLAGVGILTVLVSLGSFNVAYAAGEELKNSDFDDPTTGLWKLEDDYFKIKQDKSKTKEQIQMARMLAGAKCFEMGAKLFIITGRKNGESYNTAWDEYLPGVEARRACYFDLQTGTQDTPTAGFFGRWFGRKAVVGGDKQGGQIIYVRTAYPMQDESTTLNERTYKDLVAANNLVGQGLGGDGFAAISKVLGWVLTFFIKIITSILSLIASLAGLLMSWVFDYVTTATQPTIVLTGWIIIRDLMNMVFILAIIVMAMATILRIEGYNYKHILVKLVLMALLINFSKVIADTLYDFSNVVARIFMDQTDLENPGVYISAFVSEGKGVLAGLVAGDGGIMETVVQGILKIVALGIFTLSFVTLALLFVVRVVGIWFLIMISPVAYALNVLPFTQQYAKQWWQKFSQYLIWTPVAAFFLMLGSKQLELKGLGVNSQNDIVDALFISVFFWAAIFIAKKSEMIGGEMVAHGAEKVGKAAVQGIGHVVARNYTNKVREAADKATKEGKTGKAFLWKMVAFVDPTIAKEAWEQRSKHLHEEAYGPGVAAAHDTLNRYMPTEWKWRGKDKRREVQVFNKETGEYETKQDYMGRKTYFGRTAMEGVVNKKARELNEANLSEEERVQAYLGATESIEKQAYFKSIIANRHADGLAIMRALAKGVKPGDAKYDAVKMVQQIESDLREHGQYSDEQVGEMMSHFNELAEEGKKLRELGMSVYEWDQNFRAAGDFKGIEKLGQLPDRGDGGGDKKLVDYLNGVNMLRVEKDAAGIDTGRYFFDYKDRAGVGHSKQIAGLKDYKEVLDETKELDENSGHNFRYELTGARMAFEAKKRILRGDTEDWGKAIEPAAFLVQKGDGTWGDYTAYGRRLMQMLSPGTVSAFAQGRRFQARSLYIAGLKTDPEGKLSMENITEGPESDINWNLMEETARLNPALLGALLGKASIPTEKAKEVARILNARLDANPETNGLKLTPGTKQDEKWATHDTRGGAPKEEELPPPREHTPERVSYETIRENEITDKTHRETIERVVKEFNSGGLDLSGLQSQIDRLGMAAGKAADASQDIKFAVADAKLGSIKPRDYKLNEIPGVGLETVMSEMRQAMIQALEANHKYGSVEMQKTIKEAVQNVGKRFYPGFKGIDRAAENLAKLANRTSP